jgi:hypothetical protein
MAGDWLPLPALWYNTQSAYCTHTHQYVPGSRKIEDGEDKVKGNKEEEEEEVKGMGSCSSPSPRRHQELSGSREFANVPVIQTNQPASLHSISCVLVLVRDLANDIAPFACAINSLSFITKNLYSKAHIPDAIMHLPNHTTIEKRNFNQSF